MMILNIKAPSGDPLRLGAAKGIKFEMREPTLGDDKETWGTEIELIGSDKTHEMTVYGATAMQSVFLAVQFVMRLYEPEILGE